MRRAAKIDDNQREIVQTLVAMGCRVQSLAAVGGGVPDLLVGTPEGNWLIEVKDGSKPPSARKKTPAQQQWHDLWPGPLDVIETVDEAIDWCRNVRRRSLYRKTQHLGGK